MVKQMAAHTFCPHNASGKGGIGATVMVANQPFSSSGAVALADLT